ncbi:Uncharacterized protein JA1_001301 [Spathaspora sp. JA1]|nr:Uncharacterized protein JA1_001301 [Spathaspora sp. JA1]
MTYSSVIKASVISGSLEENKLAIVKEIELPAIKPYQLLIKSEAFAVNPTDWKHILYGLGKANNIIGSDVSGVVVEVGSEVEGFKVGDYVNAFVRGNTSDTEGAFGEYAIINPKVTVKYDHKLTHAESNEAGVINTFEGAASVGLGFVTVGLSFSHYLNIDYDQAKNKDKFILIWGGAGATGTLAVQVAKLIYGLQVITTASPKNHKYLKSLGADYVFDYNDANVVEKIKEVGNNKIIYALDTIAFPETFQKVYDATEGTPEVFLDSLLGVDGSAITTKPERVVHYGYTLAYNVLDKEVILGPVSFKQTPELLANYEEFWHTYLPKYLNQIKHAQLLILKPGLESANEALELSKQGKVSGEKVVFRV